MTKFGLVIGHSAPVGHELLDWIAAEGCQAIRCQAYGEDQHTLTPPDVVNEMIREIEAAGMTPYVTIREPHQIASIADGCAVGFGNEPDLGARFGWPDPDELVRKSMETIGLSGGRHQLSIGCVSNLNKRGFAFLRRFPWVAIPSHVGVDIHRYSDDDQPEPKKPSKDRAFKGTDHRDQEIAELRRIVGYRSLTCGEVGYHLAHGLSEQGQADAMRWERSFWMRHGFDLACAYQLNSGPPGTDNHLNEYGFRRFESVEWRPVAAAWFRGE